MGQLRLVACKVESNHAVDFSRFGRVSFFVPSGLRRRGVTSCFYGLSGRVSLRARHLRGLGRVGTTYLSGVFMWVSFGPLEGWV